jgi:hypothetical protein
MDDAKPDERQEDHDPMSDDDTASGGAPEPRTPDADPGSADTDV